MERRITEICSLVTLDEKLIRYFNSPWLHFQEMSEKTNLKFNDFRPFFSPLALFVLGMYDVLNTSENGGMDVLLRPWTLWTHFFQVCHDLNSSFVRQGKLYEAEESSWKIHKKLFKLIRIIGRQKSVLITDEKSY